MASCSIYINETDLQILLNWINDCEEIAFIISNGENKWIVVDKLSTLKPKSILYLWHKKSGFTPSTNWFKRDPYKGWKGPKGADSRLPYYGPGEPSLYTLEYNPVINGNRERSHIGWIGNYYKSMGKPAPKVTELWWAKLKRFIKKNCINTEGSWAFQNTFKEMESKNKNT